MSDSLEEMLEQSRRRGLMLSAELNRVEHSLSERDRRLIYMGAIQDANEPKRLVGSLSDILTKEGVPVDSVGILRPLPGAVPGKSADLLRLEGATGIYNQFVGTVFPFDGTLSGRALTDGTSQYREFAQPRDGVYVPENVNGDAAEWAIPIGSMGGVLAPPGVLFLRRDARYGAVGDTNGRVTFSSDDQSKIREIVGNLERTLREKIIHIVSLYDDTCPAQLRKTPGESALKRVYESGYRRRRPFSLAMIDLDNLSEFNTEYGHAVTDQLLLTWSLALSSSVRSTDVSVRYGGDEFLIGFDGLTGNEAAHRLELIAKETKSLSQYPLFVKNLRSKGFTLPDVPFSFSAGVVCVDPLTDASMSHGVHNAVSYDVLFGAANKAMYDAKNAGKGRVVIESSR